MIADDVACYLEGENVGKIGRNIFVNNTPAKTLSCITIYDTGGLEPRQDYPIDSPTIQVMVREKSSNSGHEKGKQKALEIFKLLNRKQNITIGNQDALFSKAIQNVQSLGLDDQNRWMFSCNYLFRLRITDL